MESDGGKVSPRPMMVFVTYFTVNPCAIVIKCIMGIFSIPPHKVKLRLSSMNQHSHQKFVCCTLPSFVGEDGDRMVRNGSDHTGESEGKCGGEGDGKAAADPVTLRHSHHNAGLLR